jgi:murein DD-endopeptidase MepM/ murein hydrolase activator NlpD
MQSAAAVSRYFHRPRGDYTLVHGGRQVRLGPVAFWIVVGTLVVMALWSIATGTYFAFSEDVLTRLLGRQAAMQVAYEDRIAELRAQIDRITSRQLLDQEQFEQKLDLLLKRQATLDQRTVTLADDFLATGSTARTRKGQRDAGIEIPRPSPLKDTDRDARLTAPVDTHGFAGALTRVSRSLDKIEDRQTALLGGLEAHFDAKARHMRDVLDDLGINAKSRAPAAVGGPFVPARPPRSSASAFDRQLYRVNVARAQVDRINRALVTVPVRKPVNGELEMSSPFGVRTDPFLGRPAMHTGLDLRGDKGEPVHVTADGKVTVAGWDGGYGRMVEVNHGHGLATRYGHLSEIDVKVGQIVHIGQVIGRIGSTGRSTGPHLHYETRINDEPVDPRKFLHAGRRLGKL